MLRKLPCNHDQIVWDEMKRKREKEKPKLRTVNFKLNKKMTMPQLCVDHSRKEVEALFCELYKKGYGSIIKGKKGQNNPTYFVFTDSFPETYDIEIEYFRERKTNSQKTEETSSKNENDIRTNSVYANTTIDIIFAMKRTAEPYPSTGREGGYNLSITENGEFIILERPSIGGFHTIEEAVSSSFDKIQKCTRIKSFKMMSKIQYIASQLRGFYYVRFNNELE